MKPYRFRSADDVLAFCHKITAALNKGRALRGSPSYAHDAAHGALRCGQALAKEAPGTYTAETMLETF